MANAGKKRPAPGGSSSNGAGSSGKKLKLANKAKSSKSGGRAAAAAASSSKTSLASKQKSYESASGVDGIPKRQRTAAAIGSNSAKSENVKKKEKGKGVVKQFVQVANGKEVFEKDGQDGSDGQGSDDDEDDDGDSVDVNDMLIPDSEDEEDGEQEPANAILQRSAFLTQIDKKELAR